MKDEEVLNKQPGCCSRIWNKTKYKLLVISVYLVICWVVVIYDTSTFGHNSTITSSADLRFWGIVARTPRGLIGIPVSPFVHVNFVHVATNTLGIVILGLILLFRGFRPFFFLSFFVIFVGGLALWCVGRPQKNGIYTIHLGASLLLFGWLAYLLFLPCFERPLKLKTLAITVLVGLLYSSSILVIFQTDHLSSVSWEGHLCGLFAGFVAALLEWFIMRRCCCKSSRNNSDKDLEMEGKDILDDNENSKDDSVVTLDNESTRDPYAYNETPPISPYTIPTLASINDQGYHSEVETWLHQIGQNNDTSKNPFDSEEESKNPFI
eukprot:TRINITY_DN7871_c0_g1_i1.p1 TRINITY_DN7871_c0_g1~~TRINITY_DN7871_c0_g1_i1.p1  ORF type:complete len:334 (-),score=34.71 TRINITY_DN7871_c0_g1_i1:74-1039(-)